MSTELRFRRSTAQNAADGDGHEKSSQSSSTTINTTAAAAAMTQDEQQQQQQCQEEEVEGTAARDYGSAKAYADEVSKWSQSVRCWSAYQQMIAWTSWQQQQQSQTALVAQMQASQASHLQQMEMANAIALHQQNGAGARPPAAAAFTTVRLNLTRVLRGVGQQQPTTILVQQHTVPSFLRRVAAEALDSFLFFFFKLMFVYLLVEFDIIELEQFERILSHEADIKTLIDVTQGLFSIELLCKIFAALLEALCLSYGVLGYPSGCTPGKWIMGLRVISCLDVQPAGQTADRVTVTGLPALGIRSSMIRSMLKNTLTTFLFPLSTAFYVFNFNRALYDLAAKTIVVDL